MAEFMFCCNTCTEDLVFEGDYNEATAVCPNCGDVSICPGEVYDSINAEARMDAARDDRLER
jgi:Zn-finger nucleic acid-binding protein